MTSPDTRFSLPAVDDPASTETGVILMGLDAVQLLAGLGLAALAEDATAVTLLVDQIRHGGQARLTLGHLVSLGARRWQADREPPLPEGPAAPLRLAWARAYQAVLDRQAGPPAAGPPAAAGQVGPPAATGQAGPPAATAYLTACLLRRAEIDRHASGDRA